MLSSTMDRLQENIVAFKFQSVDNRIVEVVGKVMHVDKDILRIANPQALVILPRRGTTEANSPQQYGMINFMLASDNTIVDFNKTLVGAIGIASDAAKAEWTKLTDQLSQTSKS